MTMRSILFFRGPRSKAQSFIISSKSDRNGPSIARKRHTTSRHSSESDRDGKRGREKRKKPANHRGHGDGSDRKPSSHTLAASTVIGWIVPPIVLSLRALQPLAWPVFSLFCAFLCTLAFGAVYTCSSVTPPSRHRPTRHINQRSTAIGHRSRRWRSFRFDSLFFLFFPTDPQNEKRHSMAHAGGVRFMKNDRNIRYQLSSGFSSERPGGGRPWQADDSRLIRTSTARHSITVTVIPMVKN